MSGTRESSIVYSFFKQVYVDLRTGRRSKYVAFSASEFKRLLEVECGRRVAEAKAEAKQQAQAIVEAKRLAEAQAKAKERERRARADFDALGKEMAKTTDRKERIELGRKLKAIAPYTGDSYVPEKHCKNCFVDISLAINPRCLDCKGYICLNCECCFCEPDKDYDNECWNCHSEISKETSEYCIYCGWYICSNCGSCKKPVCDRAFNPFHNEADDHFLPDYPDDLSQFQSLAPSSAKRITANRSRTTRIGLWVMLPLLATT